MESAIRYTVPETLLKLTNDLCDLVMSISFFAVWFAVSGVVYFGMGMHRWKPRDQDPFDDEAHPLNPQRLIASIILAAGIGFVAAALILYGFEQTLAER